jgi:hypothetical protein
MLYTIETSSGFVKAIKTLGGELNGIAEYTNDRSQAKTFTKQVSYRNYAQDHFSNTTA